MAAPSPRGEGPAIYHHPPPPSHAPSLGHGSGSGGNGGVGGVGGEGDGGGGGVKEPRGPVRP